MLSPHLLSLMLTMAPSLVFAGLFTRDSRVTMLDQKGFRKAMEPNETAMVAFVAPWCGHCQRMSPEFSKAAKEMAPLVPFYAVDCDDEKNKPLCAEQRVQGFPTVKLFPRGKQLPPMTYQGDRTADSFFQYASLRIPKSGTKLSTLEDVEEWVKKTTNSGKPRALLLTKSKKLPLLWKVLGNKFLNQVELGTHRDIDGKTSVAMGFEAGGEKESKVLIYPIGGTSPARYEGKTKLEPLTTFFKSVIDGTAELNIIKEKEDTAEPEKEEEASVFESTAEQVVITASESTPAERPTDEL